MRNPPGRIALHGDAAVGIGHRIGEPVVGGRNRSSSRRRVRLSRSHHRDEGLGHHYPHFLSTHIRLACSTVNGQCLSISLDATNIGIERSGEICLIRALEPRLHRRCAALQCDALAPA